MMLAAAGVETPILGNADRGIYPVLDDGIFGAGAFRTHFQGQVRRLASLPGQVELAPADCGLVNSEGQVDVRLAADVEVGRVVAEDGVAAEEHVRARLEVGEPAVHYAQDFIYDEFLFHGFGHWFRFVGIVLQAGVVDLAPLDVGQHRRSLRGCSHHGGTILPHLRTDANYGA